MMDRGRDSTKPTSGTTVGVSEKPDAFQGGIWPGGVFWFLTKERRAKMIHWQTASNGDKRGWKP